MNDNNCTFCNGTGKEPGHIDCAWCDNSGKAQLAQPAEQHQGKPAAWLREDGSDAWTAEKKNDAIAHNGAPGAAIAAKYSQPLYIHAAPGEVERLKTIADNYSVLNMDAQQELVKLRAQLDTVTADRDAEKAMKAKAREQRDTLRADLETMRRKNNEYCEQLECLLQSKLDWEAMAAKYCTQLGEAHSLLQRAMGYPMPYELRERMRVALSASAEPNQCDGCQAGIPLTNGTHRMGKPGGYPDAMSCQAHKYASAVPSAPGCETCSGHGIVGNILNAETCMDCTPSAPVDENAEFEAWRKEQIASLVRMGYPDAARAFRDLGSVQWAGWQARAALERKS